ncbi:MAG: GTP 3',8-cyclase MoaA [Candidatus Thermoplasmatota archaeon]
MVIDAFGREVRSMRISVTHRCNMNCFYCHNEGENFCSEEMSIEEIEEIVRAASNIGIRKIKITGGEPLLREDLAELISRIRKYLEEISLTTNGTLLSKFAEELKEAGLERVNISLDTLDEKKYEEICGKALLYKALEGIESAIEFAFFPIKLNTVVLKGINDMEFDKLLYFATKKNVILQLIELYPFSKALERYYCSLEDFERSLKRKAVSFETNELHNRKKYFIPFNGSVSEVEVVRPMHNKQFCKNCRRVRITADGKVKGCISSLPIKLDKENLEESLINAIRARVPRWWNEQRFPRD